MAKIDDGAHDDRIVRVVEHVAHEGAVDLEFVDREPTQVRERGVAGAEIVEDDRDAAVMEAVEQPLDHPGIAAEKHALGDLDLEMVHWHLCRRQGLRDLGVQVAVGELCVGHIDRDLADGHAAIGPGSGLLRHPFEHELADRHD